MSHDPENCSCGALVVKAEIRVVRRCAKGHIVGSKIAPAAIQPAQLAEPIRSPQLVALHARAEQLDRAMGVKAGTSKRAALAFVGHEGSSKDMTADQASRALDWLATSLEDVI